MPRHFLLLILAASTMMGQTLDILYSFQERADGANPSGTLVEVQPGTFLGTTAAGENGGTVFQISSSGAFSTLLSFNPNTQGAAAIGQLYPASNGFLYGVNTSGNGSYSGSLFAVSTAGKLQILQPDSYEASPLVEASDGNLYGIEGNASTENYSVFRMTSAGSMTNICNLGPNARSIGPLLQASDGNLYGMTAGINGSRGFLFSISTAGDNFKIIHTFNAGKEAKAA